MGWLFFAAILWLLFHFKMRKTLLVLGLSLYSVTLIVLAFVLGAFGTFIFTDQIRTWYLLDSWTTALVDSQWIHTNFWAIFFLPLVFVVDVLRWIFHITIFQGNPALWCMTIIGVWGAGRVWYYGIKSFSES